jgi:hypothetical protein
LRWIDKSSKPADSQYETVKKENSGIGIQGEIQEGFGAASREHAENLGENLYELTQHDNHNLAYSESMYETAQWDESSKMSHQQSHPTVSASISAAQSNEDFYAEIPAQANVVDRQVGDEKGETDIYAVIIKS